MLHRLKGVGLPNVFLSSGFAVEGNGDTETVSYADLDELHSCIAQAIATRNKPLTAAELRFLRKQLGLTQEEVGALGGKSGQAVAKWEKAQLPVPTAEGNLLRLVWLHRYARRAVSTVLQQLMLDGEAPAEPCGYVFSFDGSKWVEDGQAAAAAARQLAQAPTLEAISKAMSDASVTLAHTGSQFKGANVVVRSDPEQVQGVT